MKNVMVDLETMGNGTEAPIIAVGAVFFDPWTGLLGKGFYTDVSLESSVASGGRMDASTVLWWLQQEEAARKPLYTNELACTLTKALSQLSDFLGKEGPGKDYLQVWGNGIAFDNVILRESYKREGIDVPWSFWNDRDVRTMVELGQAVGFNPKVDLPFEGVRHNALADAEHQARYVSAIWQRVFGREAAEGIDEG